MIANGPWMHRALRGVTRVAAISLLLVAATTAASAGEVRFSGEGHAQHPVWAPGATSIAFEVNRFGDGVIDLYVSSIRGGAVADNGQKIPLPGGSNAFGGGKQVVVSPAWHPVQPVLVFEGSNGTSNFRLYYAQPGGAAAAELIQKSTSTPATTGDLTFPSFSNDASQLVFVSDARGNGDLAVRDNNAGTVSWVHPSATTGSEMYPQFDEDASHLVFTRKLDDVETLYTYDLASGSEMRIGKGTRPNVTASGYVVYFTNERNSEEWDLARVAFTGGSETILARNVRLPHRARPALSPDGQWVAFAYDDPSKANSVWLHSVTGSDKIEITTEFVACGEPALARNSSGNMLLAYTALPQSGADWRFMYIEDVTNRVP